MNEEVLQELGVFVEGQYKALEQLVSEAILARESEAWSPGKANLVLSKFGWPGYSQALWWKQVKGPALARYLTAPAGARKRDTRTPGTWRAVYEQVLGEVDIWWSLHERPNTLVPLFEDWLGTADDDLALLEVDPVVESKRGRYVVALIWKTIAGQRDRLSRCVGV